MSKPVPGYLHEIFYSLQGEGPWVGKPQLFVRFAGCSQRCSYCDTGLAKFPNPNHWLGTDPKTNKTIKFINPVMHSVLADTVLQYLEKVPGMQSLAITGGEPMEQSVFLVAFVKSIKKRSRKTEILLETNGLEYKAANQMNGLFDYISMDIKLESVAGIVGAYKKHELFLKNIPEVPGCVKVVVDPKTHLSEIRKAAYLLKKQGKKWTFVIQPDSRADWKKNQNLLIRFAEHAAAIYPKVRVIPQMHIGLGLR